jgi:CDP-diacylglycerol--glycerol-3-phosphate 3-phosphatidyltransferase
LRITLATWISLVRIPLAIGFAMTDDVLARVSLLVAAGVSDFLDGRLARALQQGTKTGEIVDPIADKIFALTTLATLVFEGRLRAWEAVLLLLRDIATSAGFAIAALTKMRVHFQARFSGKVVTVLQVCTILAVTVGMPARILILLCAAAGLYAIADYARAAATSLRRPAQAG